MKRLSEGRAHGGSSMPPFRVDVPRDFGAGRNAPAARHRRSSTSTSTSRFAAYNVFPFTRDVGVYYSARPTHERSIFPLFLRSPAMSRVNGPLSRSVPQRLSRFYLAAGSSSLCPVSLLRSPLRFYPTGLLCLSIPFHIGERIDMALRIEVKSMPGSRVPARRSTVLCSTPSV